MKTKIDVPNIIIGSTCVAIALTLGHSLTYYRPESIKANEIKPMVVNEELIREIELDDSVYCSAYAALATEESNSYFPLSDNDRYIVESIVCGEAGNQDYEGKKAVANCILNAAIKDNIPVSEVRTKYGYEGWQDVNEYANECMKAYGNTNLADEVVKAVEDVFDNGNLIDDSMLWFCTKNSNSSFHRSMRHVVTIGNHRFYGEW